MIIKERVRNVVGAGDVGLTQVVKAVQAWIPSRFTSDDFQRAWKKLECPAPTNSLQPERTDKKHLRD
ncbi:hypothetical protein [Kribbella sp. NPDC004875]|uniref:hypothetical protein n=1 Tax=Kribbella sp. NPDC004875 TaxID=3364107 RepID=UPI003674D84D